MMAVLAGLAFSSAWRAGLPGKIAIRISKWRTRMSHISRGFIQDGKREMRCEIWIREGDKCIGMAQTAAMFRLLLFPVLLFGFLGAPVVASDVKDILVKLPPSCFEEWVGEGDI